VQELGEHHVGTVIHIGEAVGVGKRKRLLIQWGRVQECQREGEETSQGLISFGLAETLVGGPRRRR
jgi:hypothetical protein